MVQFNFRHLLVNFRNRFPNGIFGKRVPKPYQKIVYVEKSKTGRFKKFFGTIVVLGLPMPFVCYGVNEYVNEHFANEFVRRTTSMPDIKIFALEKEFAKRMYTEEHTEDGRLMRSYNKDLRGSSSYCVDKTTCAFTTNFVFALAENIIHVPTHTYYMVDPLLMKDLFSAKDGLYGIIYYYDIDAGYEKLIGSHSFSILKHNNKCTIFSSGKDTDTLTRGKVHTIDTKDINDFFEDFIQTADSKQMDLKKLYKHLGILFKTDYQGNIDHHAKNKNIDISKLPVKHMYIPTCHYLPINFMGKVKILIPEFIKI